MLTQIPITFHPHAARVDAQVMTRKQLANIFQWRAWSTDIHQSEVLSDGTGVDLSWHLRVAQQRFQLRRENKLVRSFIIIERLHAQPITGDEKPLPVLVPQGERE